MHGRNSKIGGAHLFREPIHLSYSLVIVTNNLKYVAAYFPSGVAENYGLSDCEGIIQVT